MTKKICPVLGPACDFCGESPVRKRPYTKIDGSGDELIWVYQCRKCDDNMLLTEHAVMKRLGYRIGLDPDTITMGNPKKRLRPFYIT